MDDLLRHQGNYKKAEEYHWKCYEGRLRVLGEDHPNTLDSMNNLGNLYESQCNYKKAEEYYLKDD